MWIGKGYGQVDLLCCLSEPCCLLRQPSSSGLQWLPPVSHTGFPFLVVVLPREMELQYFDLWTFPIASQPHWGGYMKGEEPPEPPQPRARGHVTRIETMSLHHTGPVWTFWCVWRKDDFPVISMVRVLGGVSAPPVESFSLPSVFSLAFKLWKSWQPLCKSRNWIRQWIFFWLSWFFGAGLNRCGTDFLPLALSGMKKIL